MAVRGRLTEVEKLAIRQLVSDGKNATQINQILGRPENSKLVQKFIDKEIVIKKEIKPIPELQADKKKKLMEKFVDVGIHGDDATKLIEKALRSEEVTVDSEVNEIYNNAIKRVGALELMIRNSQGARNNVAIMTEAASARGDNYPQRGQSRSVKGSLYKIDSGETS